MNAPVPFILSSSVAAELDPSGHLSYERWEKNGMIKRSYKELKYPPSGSWTDGGKKTSKSFKFYNEMDQIHSQRDTINSVLVLCWTGYSEERQDPMFLTENDAESSSLNYSNSEPKECFLDDFSDIDTSTRSEEASNTQFRHRLSKRELKN